MFYWVLVQQVPHIFLINSNLKTHCVVIEKFTHSHRVKGYVHVHFGEMYLADIDQTQTNRHKKNRHLSYLYFLKSLVQELGLLNSFLFGLFIFYYLCVHCKQRCVQHHDWPF